MKIINERVKDEGGQKLSTVEFGKVVQFNKRFNSNYPPNELFLVLNVCNLYFPAKYGGERDKQGVVCLANGVLSYVDSARRVTVMRAEVTVDGPA